MHYSAYYWVSALAHHDSQESRFINEIMKFCKNVSTLDTNLVISDDFIWLLQQFEWPFLFSVTVRGCERDSLHSELGRGNPPADTDWNHCISFRARKFQGTHEQISNRRDSQEERGHYSGIRESYKYFKIPDMPYATVLFFLLSFKFYIILYLIISFNFFLRLFFTNFELWYE